MDATRLPLSGKGWIGAAVFSVALHAAVLCTPGPQPSLPAPEAKIPARIVLRLAAAPARTEVAAPSTGSEGLGGGSPVPAEPSPVGGAAPPKGSGAAPAASKPEASSPGGSKASIRSSSKAEKADRPKGSAAPKALEALAAPSPAKRTASTALSEKAPTRLEPVFARPTAKSEEAAPVGAAAAAGSAGASWQSAALDLSGAAPAPGRTASSEASGPKPGSRVDAQARQRRGDLAFYLRAWQSKVEAEGRRSYPKNPFGGAAEGRLRLRVSVRSDGSVVAVAVARSSGMEWLDRAAGDIARAAGPYAPFPPELAADYPLLEIEREFAFLES